MNTTQSVMEYSPARTDPPFEETYRDLFLNHISSPTSYLPTTTTTAEVDLPLVDLRRLGAEDEEERERCKRQIAEAAAEWGFFQVVNHGISQEILEDMAREQVKVFREPFNKKKRDKCMNMSLSPGSYRWGTPTATCLRQLSWSEAFHIPLTDIIHTTDDPPYYYNNHDHATFRYEHMNVICICCEKPDSKLILFHPYVDSSTVKQFAATVSELAHKLANILAEKLGHDDIDQAMAFFEENCLPSTCYLRMNRYPPCPKFSQVFGLMPHTDSDFLTILYQDHVGGLQLVKDGKWIAVKPNPQALIVNVGDLFQAWSNGVYKSVEHRVMVSPKAERFSTAYFLCPSNDTVIQSWSKQDEPSMYRKFSFREYRQQVQDDVRKLGYKMGLSRFLVNF